MKNACLALSAPLSTPALIRCERAYPAGATVRCGLSSCCSPCCIWFPLVYLLTSLPSTLHLILFIFLPNWLAHWLCFWASLEGTSCMCKCSHQSSAQQAVLFKWLNFTGLFLYQTFNKTHTKWKSCKQQKKFWLMCRAKAFLRPKPHECT